MRAALSWHFRAEDPFQWLQEMWEPLPRVLFALAGLYDCRLLSAYLLEIDNNCFITGSTHIILGDIREGVNTKIK